MIESAARAGAFEARSTASSYFVWDVPQKPFSVQIGKDLLARLDREGVDSFRSVSARGSEVGGFLLGKIGSGARPVVWIEDWEPVSCDYGRGPLYRLSAGDKERLDQAMRHKPGERGFEVVGFFRSNTRKGLSLDADDMALFDERFAGPQQMFLLVRPFATKRSVGALFIREGGVVRGESAALEFPLPRTAEPEAPAQAAAPREEAPAVASLGSAPAPAPAPKPPARAQVVSIAPRREPPPPIEEAPAEEVQAVPEPPPAAPVITRAPAFAESYAEAPAEGAHRFGKWLWIAAGSVVAAAIVLGVMMYPGFHRPAPAPRQAPPVAAENPGLTLRVERNAGQLMLTWNREAESVKSATRAVLSISDGARHEDVKLDLQQLRNGSVVYSPVTADVSFKLDVTGSDTARSQSESVRVLGRPSAMPEKTEAVAAQQAPGAEQQAGQPNDAASQATAPAQPRRQVRFPDSLAERLRPARPAELAELPGFEIPAGQQPAALPEGLASAPTVAPPQAAPAPAPAAPAPRPNVGGKVQEAKVLSRVEPAYPPIARQTRVRGNVRLLVTVGKDGKVANARVEEGHALLREAALTAVRQWRFSPALLNGQPVETSMRVDIGFMNGN